MKIKAAVRQLFADNEPAYQKIKARADALFTSACSERKWHYESRTKAEDSFALKVETGRVEDPANMEDFFACTIVVRNSTEIQAAVDIVLAEATQQYRRPENAKIAGRPSSFEFDDLRMYVKLKPVEGLPPAPELERVFEVQIRTFLFHAWQIATHNLTYKSDAIDWGRARIAFQVRAMLEQAEVAIRSATELAKLDILAREDQSTTDLKKVLELIQGVWAKENLPRDQKRLAENVYNVIRALDVSLERLAEILNLIKGEGPPLDPTPYQAIVSRLWNDEQEKFKRFVKRDRARTKIVVYQDSEPPDWVRSPAAKHIQLL